MPDEQNSKIFRTILELLISNRVFVKCPECGKSLGIFEVYNENCSYCGDIEYDKMVVMKGFDANEEEGEGEEG